MTWLKAVLTYHVSWLEGAPVWALLLVAGYFLLPTLNEWVARTKWTTAQTLLQAIGRILHVALGRIPAVRVVTRVLGNLPAPTDEKTDDAKTPPDGTATPPPPPPPLPPAAAMLILAASVFFAMACTPGARALLRCELNHLPQTLQSVIASIVGIAASPSSTVGQLEQLGVGLAPGQLDCAVQAVAVAVEGKSGAKAAVDETTATIVKNLRAYLAKHKASAETCQGVMWAANDGSKE